MLFNPIKVNPPSGVAAHASPMQKFEMYIADCRQADTAPMEVAVNVALVGILAFVGLTARLK